MTEKYDHIHKDFAHLMTLSKEDRCMALDKDFMISYPKANEIIQIMLNLMNKPQRTRAQNLLIIGEPNMGKTTIARKFYKMNPDRKIETNAKEILIKPVIYVNIQGPSEKEFFTSILDQFWAPYSTSHSTLKLKQQVIYLLRLCKVRTIIFDEIHNILTGTPLKQRTIMDQIKNLSNELMIPMIGVGTKSAANVLYSDMQHVSRFDVVKLERWELDNNFRGLLNSFEKRLPLKKASNLSSKEKTILLYDLSQGNIGNLHRILIECASYAIQNDIEEISLDVIKKFLHLKAEKISNPKKYATS